MVDFLEGTRERDKIEVFALRARTLRTQQRALSRTGRTEQKCKLFGFERNVDVVQKFLLIRLTFLETFGKCIDYVGISCTSFRSFHRHGKIARSNTYRRNVTRTALLNL